MVASELGGRSQAAQRAPATSRATLAARQLDDLSASDDDSEEPRELYMPPRWLAAKLEKARRRAHLDGRSGRLELDLSGNALQDDGAVALWALLTHSQGEPDYELESLTLSGNGIGDGGAGWIAEALQTNRTLRALDLSRNMLSNSAAADIADALYSNESLESLVLTQNAIGIEGACELAEALRSNKSLCVLHLDDNPIGEFGVCTLAECLRTNNTMSDCRLARPPPPGAPGKDVGLPVADAEPASTLDIALEEVKEICRANRQSALSKLRPPEEKGLPLFRAGGRVPSRREAAAPLKGSKKVWKPKKKPGEEEGEKLSYEERAVARLCLCAGRGGGVRRGAGN